MNMIPFIPLGLIYDLSQCVYLQISSRASNTVTICVHELRSMQRHTGASRVESMRVATSESSPPPRM
jgi:hypothetical protein